MLFRFASSYLMPIELVVYWVAPRTKGRLLWVQLEERLPSLGLVQSYRQRRDCPT